MPRSVRTNLPLTQLPLGPGTDTRLIETANSVVLLTDAEFGRIPAALFSGGTLTDLGAVPDGGDGVVTQAAVVAAPLALTSTNAAANPPTQTEFNALRTDVTNLRTTVANLLVALKGAGKPMAP